MTDVLELNDLELTLYRDGEARYRAPAVAIVREGEMLFGKEAVRLARIHPQQTNQQYLNRMNADPLPQPVRTAANHADLVYLHLKELAGEALGDTVLAVPGSMNADQLGILLGICQEAGLDVGGFVNAAVASVTSTPLPSRVTHIDLFLQHMQVSELAIDGEVRHERSFEVRDCGFNNLVDGWVNLIADRFVQETRFDPLHTAATEQQLYNQAYDWARSAHLSTEVGFQVTQGEQQRRVEVPRAQLEQKALQRVQRLIDALPDRHPLALTARAAGMPGLGDLLKQAGFEMTPLAADAVATGCGENMDLVRTAESGLRLVNRLPHTSSTVAYSPADVPVPTHLLKGHIARPLSAGILPFLHQDDAGIEVIPDAGVTLNAKPVQTGARLALGDVIGTPQGEFTAIRLES